MINFKLLKLITIYLIIIFFSYFSLTQIRYEYYGAKYLKYDIYDPKQVDFVALNSNRKELVKRIAIKSFNSKIIDCKQLKSYADNLIELDNRSSFGYFLNAVCYEKLKEFNLALESINKSLVFEPNNQDYLVSKAILLISLGNLEESEFILKEVLINYPNNGQAISTLRYIMGINNQ